MLLLKSELCIQIHMNIQFSQQQSSWNDLNFFQFSLLFFQSQSHCESVSKFCPKNFVSELIKTEL